MGIIYCYHDLFQWGPELAAEIQKRKGSSQMMTHAVQVENEIGTGVFIHVSDRERQYTQELAAEIGKKENVLMVPTAREISLHDDLLAAYGEFGQWMPTTWLLQSLEQVQDCLNDMPYPIVSLTRSKAIRHQRILQDPEQAYAEAVAVFGDEGLLLVGGTSQRGYLIWQPRIQIAELRWNVFMLGKRYAVITQTATGVDPTLPGIAFRVVDVMKPEYASLLDFCRGFVMACDLDWACIEVVAMPQKPGVVIPFVTGYSVSWPMAWFERGGMIFESDCGLPWQSTGIPAVKMWSVVAGCIMEKLKHG